MKTIYINHKESKISNKQLLDIGVDIHIRLALEHDMDSIIKIEESCFDPNIYDSLLTKKIANRFLKKGNGLFLVYEDNGVLGYAQIMFKKNSYAARFFSLAVLPLHHSNGIASELFKAVELITAHLSLKYLNLEIREDNITLYKRYEKMGYQTYKIVDKYYPDGMSAIKMRRMI